MSISEERFRERVDAWIDDTLLVAWDGCHKIYMAVDEIERAWFAENYPNTFVGYPDAMADQLWDWWQDSCSLRFVSAVSHNESNPNDGFASVIEQFDPEDEEENDDEYDQ